MSKPTLFDLAEADLIALTEALQAFSTSFGEMLDEMDDNLEKLDA